MKSCAPSHSSTHGCPTDQADPRNRLKYQQLLLPPTDGHTKPRGSMGLSPLFGAVSVALLLFCQAQCFFGGGLCCSRGGTLNFLPSQLKGSTAETGRETHSPAREQPPLDRPRKRGIDRPQRRGIA